MKNSFCSKILKFERQRTFAITSGNAEVGWRCQYTRKKQIKKMEMQSQCTFKMMINHTSAAHSTFHLYFKTLAVFNLMV